MPVNAIHAESWHILEVCIGEKGNKQANERRIILIDKQTNSRVTEWVNNNYITLGIN